MELVASSTALSLWDSVSLGPCQTPLCLSVSLGPCQTPLCLSVSLAEGHPERT